MIRRSKDVDMKPHISNHELTPVIQSLTRHDETLLGGWERKSELTARVLGEANVTVLQVFPYKSECLAIDAMYRINQISTKLLWIKTGHDLATEFCKLVDQLDGAETVAVGFEWYFNESLRHGYRARTKVKVKQNKSTTALNQIQI